MPQQVRQAGPKAGHSRRRTCCTIYRPARMAHTCRGTSITATAAGLSRQCLGSTCLWCIFNQLPVWVFDLLPLPLCAAVGVESVWTPKRVSQTDEAPQLTGFNQAFEQVNTAVNLHGQARALQPMQSLLAETLNLVVALHNVLFAQPPVPSSLLCVGLCRCSRPTSSGYLFPPWLR